MTIFSTTLAVIAFSLRNSGATTILGTDFRAEVFGPGDVLIASDNIDGMNAFPEPSVGLFGMFAGFLLLVHRRYDDSHFSLPRFPVA